MVSPTISAVRKALGVALALTLTVRAAYPAGQAKPAPAVLNTSTAQTAAAPAAAAVPTSAPVAANAALQAAPVVQAAASAKISAPVLTLPQQIAALPRLDNAGIDVDARGKAILSHLNAVLRYYRAVAGPMQKVGEPSDVLYSEQATAQATQMAQYAFQSAKNLAALLAKLAPTGQTPQQAETSDDDKTPPQLTEAQRMAQARVTVQNHLTDLQTQDAALDKQIATAKAKDLPALRQLDEQVEGQVDLQKAMLEALGKVSSMADASGNSGLAGDIDRLLRPAPELASTTLKPTAPPVLENLSNARDSGVSSQAVVLFQLLSARRDIDSREREVDALKQQAVEMREPMVKLLRATIQQGDAAMQAAPDPKATAADVLTATRKHYDTLAATFRVLSTATLPLSQEIVLLENSRANLQSWRTAVDTEYQAVLRSLLLRVLFIALVLGMLFILGQVWQRLTVKYVHDLRRRRQLLVVRRLVLGLLAGLVAIFGFVTQFSSLATFAGFITAGIAVGLQTILLSVAAYFFIIGRYGVRVGDRITVAGVTGDVVDVGLVRFYMMELTGTGTELHATGRIAVFANSVLFQAGTPLYKQMPGTEYAWHELTVKLKPDTDYKAATAAVLNAVTTVYNTYKPQIDEQHHQVETWMDTVLEAPQIEPRLQLAETGLQYAVLFPVEIKDAAVTDEQIVHTLLADIAANEGVRNAIASPPTVKAVIKG